MNFNKEQQAVIDCKSNKILILAGAGSGKTATMLGRISKQIDDGADPSSFLVLTFTRAAALNMRQRYLKDHKGKAVPNFSTFHAFCYQLLCTDYSVLRELGYSKVPTICDSNEERKIRQMSKMRASIKLTDKKLESGQFISPIEKYEYERFQKAIKKQMITENTITFKQLMEEVVRLFIEGSPCIQKYKDKYHFIYIDEFQDTDPFQWKFANTFSNTASIVVVGDTLQCQPSGTLVTLADRSVKHIEDLKEGDYVLSYNRRDGRYLQARTVSPSRYCSKINKIAKRWSDNIVRITTSNHTSCYTRDHITYAKIHYEGHENDFVTYMMRNDQGWWRVGSTKLFLDCQQSGFGPRLRLHSEHGNAVWILGIYKSSKEAWLAEQICAYEFGIPQITWNHENVPYDLSDLFVLYSKLDDLKIRAEKCLKYFNKHIDYPFFVAEDTWIHFSKLHLFECHVGNLIPELFDIVVPCCKPGTSELHNTYERIQSIVDEPAQYVYSLDVDKHHNYVADGILTHNCIYSFRGCTNSIIKSLSTDRKWTQMRLHENYRSTVEIVEYANDLAESYADSSYRVTMTAHELGCPVCVTPLREHMFSAEQLQSKERTAITDVAPRLEGTVAILARTNKEVSLVKTVLDSENISYTESNKSSDVPEILHSVVSNDYLMEWTASFLKTEEYAHYLRWRTLYYQDHLEYPTIAQYVNRYDGMSKLHSYFTTIFEIRKVLNDNKADVFTKILHIYKYLGMKEADCFEASEDFTNGDIINYIVKRFNESKESNIYVGTVHSVKGLEYDNVMLLGVDDKSWRLDNEDNLNLFYVGVTRAKKKLIIFKYEEGEEGE